MKGWDHAIVFDPEGKVIYIIKLRMIPYRYVIVISILFHFLIFTFHFAINYSLAQEKGETLLGQGKELLDERDYSGALQVLLEAAAQGPENPEVYNYLGEAYYRLKRLDEAVVALKEGVTLKADYLPAHLGLGIVYEAMGNIEGAMSEFREVLKIGEVTSDLPEVKIARETRKILGLPDLPVTLTTVRVPVFRCHSEAVNVELERPLNPNEARALLAEQPGVIVYDDPGRKIYPHPIAGAGKDEVYVGRIRRDDSVKHGLNLWLVSDNLRKGAALNAIQIAEALARRAEQGSVNG